MFVSNQILMFVSDVTTNIAKQGMIVIGKTTKQSPTKFMCIPLFGYVYLSD